MVRSKLNTYKEVIVGVLGMTLLLNFLIHLDLIVFKLQVTLQNVDVARTKQSTNLSDIGLSDDRISMEACHSLAQPDQRLKLSDRIAIGCLRVSTVHVSLAQLDVLFLKYEG